MRICSYASGSVVWLLLLSLQVGADESAAPKGLKGEQSFPGRHAYVVQDVLKFCQPKKGFWIDLGAGKGQVAIPLIEATGNPVVMLDPNSQALAEGLEIARDKGIADRLVAVVGRAEALPFPDNSVDLVVSRGSIFFWDDPIQGLKEVYRVLRPGGKAYVGGGAGSGYPKQAVQRLIQERKDNMQGDEAQKWKRFVELRRPEQMRHWAERAGLREFEVMGKGAISDDEKVGQGVWLLFEKRGQETPAPSSPLPLGEGQGGEGNVNSRPNRPHPSPLPAGEGT